MNYGNQNYGLEIRDMCCTFGDVATVQMVKG
jgi:hypothetical protein